MPLPHRYTVEWHRKEYARCKEKIVQLTEEYDIVSYMISRIKCETDLGILANRIRNDICSAIMMKDWHKKEM